MKIAMVATAVPTPQMPANGPHNVNQAAALTAAGSPTVLYAAAANVPRVLGRLVPRWKRVLNRPVAYEYDDVPIRTVRGPLIPQRTYYRRHFAEPWPRITSWCLERLWVNRLDRAIDAQTPDLLYVNNGLLWGGVARAIARRRGIRFAFIEQNVIRLVRGSRAASFYKELADEAAGVFVVSDDSHKHLVEVLGMTTATLLPDGARRPAADQWDTPRPERWNGKKVVLCVGSFITRKAHRELVKAFAEASGHDDVLAIIGDPPDWISALIEELGVGDRIEFIGRMPQWELMQYMIWADLFALVSWDEPFGMVFVEAMGAGTPSIMTSDCGVAPFVENGRQGWVVPPRDHEALVVTLKTALGDADLAAMGKAGIELVEERFTWERNASDLLATLNAARA